MNTLKTLSLFLFAGLFSSCWLANADAMDQLTPVKPSAQNQSAAHPFSYDKTPLLNPDYPPQYVVKKDDTLWGIANKILQHPWQWTDLWAANPAIQNPDRIYPGDVIETHLEGDRPVVTIKTSGTVKLSPKVRTVPLDNAIPTIPLSNIKPFLSGNRIVNPQVLAGAPVVVAHEGDRIIAGTGDVIYVAGLSEKDFTHYTVYRSGEPLMSPKTGDPIGITAVYVGDAELLKTGNPATMMLANTRGEVIQGDKLLSEDPATKFQVYFTPKAPSRSINGQIISVDGGLAQAGQFQVVIIDQGVEQGLEPGDMLDIYSNSRSVNTLSTTEEFDKEKLIEVPGHKTGEMMVFRTFDKASYALILKADSAINIMDSVQNPS
ncbi:MAG: hypothetical protein K0R12_1355 [Gammaproteobacteria bacterium]|jgi:hypothetical protein|nr:hypothetical protein [Gammaproteobacteria bacterium]